MSRARTAAGADHDPQRSADQRTLEDLVAAGARLDRTRPVQHYLVCTERQDARTATLQLRDAGFDASLFENPTAVGWIVVAERDEVVDEMSISLGRSLVQVIAGRCDGATYDGWTTDLLPDEGRSLKHRPVGR